MLGCFWYKKKITCKDSRALFSMLEENIIEGFGALVYFNYFNSHSDKSTSSSLKSSS